MMPGFTPPRNRDASAAIRGYVYQVDLTLRRWIDLQPGDVLELERGEDIDHVNRSLTSAHDPEEQERMLEQVKDYQRPITLRTPAVISAIANFAEHRRTNPELSLRFCFTTTAPVTRERPSRLPPKMTGIGAWEQIRIGSTDTRNIISTAEDLRDVLRNAPRPAELPLKTWNVFQDFLASASTTEWLDFVRRFQWSTGRPPDRDLGPHIQNLLRERQIAGDEQQAETQYQRLFLYVFKLLSTPGPKRLTSDERDHQLTLPTLNATDHNLLASVVAKVCALESRVSELEHGLTNIQLQVQQVALGYTAPTIIDTGLPLILDVPPPVALLSHRRNTVQNLLQEVMSCTWTALYGGAGQGKTHLAMLLVQAQGNCMAWLRLRDLNSEEVIRRVNAACEAITGHRASSDAYREMFARATQQSILVLDDLPRLVVGDSLVEVMVLLTRAAEEFGAHILSTSSHRIPSTVAERFTDLQLRIVPCPGLTDGDVMDVLRLYNAPPHVCTPQFAGFVNTMVQRHPLLLNAAARYLRHHNWQIDDAAFDALMRSAYAAEVSNETIHRLIREVEDYESRELLYRLNLFTGDFVIKDVIAIAAVAPPVDRPRERLDSLAGLWVQYELNEQLVLSPLVKALGTDELHATTRHDGHLAIAAEILERRRINQFDALNLVMHLIGGEAFDQAAAILAKALSELIHLAPSTPESILLSLWYGLSLPTAMSLGLRIYLRGLQIAARHRFAKPIGGLINDLENLVAQATDDEAWAVFISAVHACPVLAESNVVRANALLLSAIQRIATGRMPDGSPLEFPGEAKPELLVWSHVRGITTLDQLRNWLDTIAQFSPEQVERAFSDDIGQQGCVEVANRLWLLEADKPEEEREWATVLTALNYLDEQARRLGQDLLWACAVRARVVVLAEYLHDLDNALVVTREALARASFDPQVQFLIRECMGRQYVYAGRHREALGWLTEALAFHTTGFSLVRRDALLAASRGAGELDAASAIPYTRQAVQLVENSVEIPQTEMVKTLGELAVAEWLNGNLTETFQAIDRAAEVLLANKADTETWRDLFVIFGHVSGFLSMIAHTNVGPERTITGEQYLPPFRGIFQQARLTERAMRYDGRRDCFLFAQLALFAEAVGRDERVAVWASRGLEAARSANQAIVRSGLGLTTIPAFVIDGRYGEALEVGLDASAVQIALRRQEKAGLDILTNEIDIDSALESLPNDDREQAEYNAAIHALLPIAFHLQRRTLDQPGESRSDATEVIQLCRHIRETATDERFWYIAANILEQTFLGEMRGEELVEWGNGPELQPYSVLRILCYLGATLKRDISVRDVAQAHLAMMPTVYRLIAPPLAAYRRIVLPYLVEYWSTRFQRARGLFGSPQLLGEALAEARQLPDAVQAQRILNSVSISLGIRPTGETRDWLSSGS